MTEFAEAAMSLAGVVAVQRSMAINLACRVDVLDMKGIRRIDAAAWDGLSAGAIEGNPWLTRQMVLSSADAYSSNFRALALYRYETSELVGFLPFRVIGYGPFGMGAPRSISIRWRARR